MITRMKAFFRKDVGKFHRDVRGIEAIEYLLIAALVIIAAIAGYRTLGEKLSESAVKVGEAVERGVDEGISTGGLGGGS